jgi:lysozyme
MHRYVTKLGIEFIKKHESFSSVKYICAGGYPTIGYGHKLLPTEQYDTLSHSMAENILIADLRKFERAVLKYIDNELNDNQFDALVSFTFNLGPAALQRSTLRQKINYGLYLEASREFLKWVYAGGMVLNGLIKRRVAESNLFNSIV